MDVTEDLRLRMTDQGEHMKKFADEIDKRGNGWTDANDREFRRLSVEYDATRARYHELRDAQAEDNRAAEQRRPYEAIIHSGSDSRTIQDASEKLKSFLHGELRAVDIDFTGLTVQHNDLGKWEVRDLTVGTTTAGGHTVPTSFQRKLYEYLVANSAIRQTNATVLTTDGGEDFSVPKVTSHGTAAIVGEGTALAEADPAFGTTTLESWKYGQLIEVSNELLWDNAVDLEDYLARQGGRAVGNASGRDFVTGSGTNAPFGIMNAAGTGVTAATGGTGVPTVENLIDLYFSVGEEYQRNAYWMMAPSTVNYVRKLKDGDNRYLFDFAGTGNVPTIMGRPVVSDPNIAAFGTPSKSVIFGDFSGYYIRDVRGIRFERSDSYAFNRDMVAFRAILRTDGDLVDLSGAVKILQSPST